MSLYNPAVPTGLVKLSRDYLNVQNNFSQLDTSFGIDHYAFSNQTANNGFHNRVTLPLIVGSVHPTTTAATTALYCMQDSANVGLLNYSRGPSDAVPTPLTNLQSPVTALSINDGLTVDVFNATGLTLVIGTLFATNKTTSSAFCVPCIWSGSSWTSGSNGFPNTKFSSPSTGAVLKLKNQSGSNMTNVFWTFVIERIN